MFLKTYLRLEQTNHIVKQSHLPQGFNAKKIEKPNYEEYRRLHDRVGEPYGWHKRARIANKPLIHNLISNPDNEIFVFFKNEIEVGYAYIEYTHEEGLEISDFGFFPEFTGKGLGHMFFPWLLNKIFEHGFHFCWLSTRSTNHPKVSKFYESHGFEIYKTEHVHDDGSAIEADG